jgi:hypothetical protein
MGVLSDGTPYLNQRGLAALCGADQNDATARVSRDGPETMLHRICLLAATAFLLGFGLDTLSAAIAAPPSSNEMTITYHRPPKGMEQILGTHWYIFLSGQIEADTAEKFEAFVKEHKVPLWSYVVLNSPGGSIYGGIELGRVFRKFQLNTDIGIRDSSKTDTFSYSVGKCYSSCAYAYLGGKFRYLHEGSRYGVHRFYASNSAYGNMDTAQIASAQIVEYLREMGIDPEFFTLSTKAGADEIYEPPRAVLENLSVINNGWGRTIWSIESKQGIIYLKGERDTDYGINKLLMMCIPTKGIYLHIIFDPQGRQDEVVKMDAHSLVIDKNDEPITPFRTEIFNGWFNAHYILTNDQVRRIMSAKSVGVILQWAYGAPVFLGFNAMPFGEGAEKLAGIVNSCAR